MSSSSPSLAKAVLVVIIGESVLQDRIIKLLKDLGVTGYTPLPSPRRRPPRKPQGRFSWL